MVGVDAAKTAIYDRLKIQEPGTGDFVIFRRARVGVLRALTCGKEIHAPITTDFQSRKEEAAGARNEALDLPGVRLRGAVCSGTRAACD